MKNKSTLSINTCIIIPCYNEEKGLPINEYTNFIENSHDVLLCFVNDGSSDNTLTVLENLKNTYPSKVEVVSYSKNVGKAEAIRTGMKYCYTNYNYKYIAYLDADLATTLEECYSMRSYFNDEIEFVFGSRIKRIGANIDRKKSRFLIGRIIATAISTILKLPVYDTQCGCKLFTKNLADKVFIAPFISKWLFDVEIINRIIEIYGRNNVLNKMMEVPLKSWIEKGDSKVKTSYMFKLWIDLYKISRLVKS
jgi:glycosyltransferase involved in cell wall biosynthesis